MTQFFSLAVAPHRAMGEVILLAVSGQPERRFTRQEALTVSRALKAVAEGQSSERQIYMSPIASDHDFEALAEAGGVAVTSPGRDAVTLDWDQTRALARELQALAEGSA
ncbi:hypothetical protein [Methylocystis heyeri]|uniref:Uncharacterized protein n=1 Tax=Methylocystis heyeri TaxID=391905 RepID=A0A6B8KCA2_9HYPH|nr:hypothetical protein [Methylocystis heyeri]QGM44655.1 hypothetical protein H2LOC_002535 [Methylocystis heyeri]